MCLVSASDNNEKLQCPADYADRIKNAYTNIVKLLIQFNELVCLPPAIKLSCMDGGSGLEKKFLQRKAKFHKRCKLKFNQPKTSFERNCFSAWASTLNMGLINKVGIVCLSPVGYGV